MCSPLPLHELIERTSDGDAGAQAELAEALYAELHRVAASMMAGQGPDHTLQATALVHEAWIRIKGPAKAWSEPGHFLSTAAKAMRSVLVDHSRRKGADKRGGNNGRLPIDDLVLDYEDRALDLAELDEALNRLSDFDPAMAKAVELRFFGALTVEETAQVLGQSKRTFERNWQAARSWLFAELS